MFCIHYWPIVRISRISLCIWFGIFMHNYSITHRGPSQCHARGKKIQSNMYKAALAGFNQYSMYIGLTMDTDISDNMQFGRMDVCFCGMDKKSHQSSNSVPVTYHLDTCYMSIDLADPNIQDAFKSAYGKVAELQAFTYNADNKWKVHRCR